VTLITALWCAVLAGILAPGALAQQNLPQMGEPADTALSPIEEQRLGAQFMRQIRAQLPLVRDTQINEYIQALGTRLAVASGKSEGRGFTFFVIDSPQVNAFAIPGGYVGIYVGLIDAMVREEQLAGVLAHEVAHVTQRHHARAFQTGKNASLGTAAAVLAAILIGAASPEAGQAALAAGLAASQQRAINFTRSNEIEADRIGIEILANAAFDPSAMAESFAILRRRNNLNTAGLNLEYLRTHPLDDNRIAEAADRAAALPTRPAGDGVDYALFRARLNVLSTEDPGALERAAKARNARRANAGDTYALALLAADSNRPEVARQHLDALAELLDEHPWMAVLDAHLLAQDDRRSAALARLADLDEIYPGRYSIAEQRSELLIEDRQLSQARDVILRYLRETSPAEPKAWRALADVRQRLGDSAGSHEALARWFEALNELERAESQLQLALRHVPIGSQDELRLRATLDGMRTRIAQQE